MSRDDLRFERWCAGAEGAAILRGGDANAVTLQIARGLDRPATVITGIGQIEVLSSDLQFQALRPIEWRLSRGLSSDLATAVEARNGRPVVICADVLATELALVRKQLGSKLEIITGYQLPADVIDATVVARLTEIVAKNAMIAVVPLIIHDGHGLLGPIEDALSFDLGEIEPISFEAVPEPSLEDLRRHAAFLTGSEAGVLADMHRFLKGPMSRAMLAHWRRGLVQLEGADPTLAVAAMARLDALALDVAEPARPEPRAAVGAAIRRLQDALGQDSVRQSAGPAVFRAKPGAPPRSGQSNHRVASGSRTSVVLGASGGPGDAPPPRVAAPVFLAHYSEPPGASIFLPTAFLPTAGNAAIDVQMISLAEAEQARSVAVVKALAMAEARSSAAMADALKSVDGDRQRAIAQAVGEARAALAAEHAVAFAEAVRAAEAEAALALEEAVTRAVRETSEAARASHEATLSALHAEMAAAVEAARTSAAEAAARATSNTGDEATANEAMASAIAAAVADAEARGEAKLRAAEEAADAATVEAVSTAVQAAKATAAKDRNRAVAEAIAKTEQAARQSEAAAIERALAEASLAAEHHRAEAVAQALASAAADQARAIDGALAAAARTAEDAKGLAILEALEVAAAEAEIRRATAIAEALEAANAASVEEREAAIADALGRAASAHERQLQQALADADAAAEAARNAAVAEALDRAAQVAEVSRERAVLEALASAADAAERKEAAAVATALAAAAEAAKAIKETAIAEALAAAAAAFETDKAEAITAALASAAEAARLAQAERARDACEEAARRAAADDDARRRRLEAVSKLSLADVAHSMSDAGRHVAPTSRRETARANTATCRAFLRPMRQQQPSYGSIGTTGLTELSRIKDAYDTALRGALTRVEIAVPPRAALVTVGFQISEAGRAEYIELISPSGNAAVDPAAIQALAGLTLPIPPVEVGGGIAYSALLHFE